MRDRTYWLDHVLSENNKFALVLDSGNIYTITPHGAVIQQGTFQDAAHFNSIEEALTANEEALMLLLNLVRQDRWDADDRLSAAEQRITELYSVETGTVSLTNTKTIIPFNNSKTTVALNTSRDNSDYIVVAEVLSANGNVGEIIISEQLTNGFKIEYTGSAPSATINYTVIGGWDL